MHIARTPRQLLWIKVTFLDDPPRRCSRLNATSLVDAGLMQQRNAVSVHHIDDADWTAEGGAMRLKAATLDSVGL